MYAGVYEYSGQVVSAVDGDQLDVPALHGPAESGHVDVVGADRQLVQPGVHSAGVHVLVVYTYPLPKLK